MAETREREQRFSDRMSDHEALMWNIEKDPWLNPSGAGLTILQGTVDEEHFRRTLRRAVAKMPRLYERVVPGLGRLAPPAWVPDPEFDLAYHMRRLRLPKPGTDRQLFDLAAQLYQEPLDRTRPLWRFVVIDGLKGGRSAIWSLVHHAVSDGIGQLRMAEMYQQLVPDDPLPDDVDLEGIVSAAVEAHHAKQLGGDLTDGFPATVGQSLAHLVRRELGVARRVAGEVAIWPADPKRARDTLDGAVRAVSSTLGALTGSDNEVAGGSPLWKNRSRHRHLEHVALPLEELKAVSKRLGVTINDVFLAGLTEGAIRYHADRDVEVDAFNTSFVLSTRHDSALGGNSFTPVPVQVPGTAMELEERIADIHRRIAVRRESMSTGGGMGALSGVANLLPTSVVTSAARAAAGKIDFATSNLRGAPFALYVSGARVLRIVTMGPVAGTACNATAMSYENSFDIGLFIDPVAIDAPGDFRDAIEAAFADILAL
ncbi:MAG TPA: wax ester/triacylglycerol synthase domain-containing protein [Ilumatobacteraceae bacterium]|nr:wax ester/triacylglycerol synthase domain-containing protein [Ilumatobacteraceae bacterium]